MDGRLQTRGKMQTEVTARPGIFKNADCRLQTFKFACMWCYYHYQLVQFNCHESQCAPVSLNITQDDPINAPVISQ